MSCGGGVCSPTSKDATLNAADLQTMLSGGSVEVVTTGTGVQASNIRVGSPLSWANASALTLDAYRSVSIQRPMAITGTGALAIVTNDGGTNGTFSIERSGGVQFQSLSSSLTINGSAYTLVNSISTLASSVATNPSGDYALSENYDASADGTYAASPVPTTFNGTFDGLGNSISNLSIDASSGAVGLFSYVAGNVQHLSMEHVNIIATGKRQLVGGLAGQATVLYEDYVSGRIEVGDSSAGGLAGDDGNSISFSSSSARVVSRGSDSAIGSLVGQGWDISNSSATGEANATLGGCVGDLAGTATSVMNSFATGEAHVGSAALAGDPGGLVGCGNGEITNSYSTGTVISSVPKKGKKVAVNVGGLVGYMVGTITSSYSTGRVHAAAVTQKGGYGIYKGGLVGTVQDNGSTPFTDTYWDTTTSKITNPSEGSSNDWPGITGLTTSQLQAGLPTGFDPSVWAEDPAINGGMPYLKANPPKK